MAENQTIRYLKTFKPDGTLYVPGPYPGQIPPNRIPTFRLSWRSSPPDNFMDYSDLARTLSTSLPDAHFFLDTCFVTGQELDESLWDALLERHIVFTPLVFQTELQKWMTRSQVKNARFRSIVSDALSKGHPSITFLDPSTSPFETRVAGVLPTLCAGPRLDIGKERS